MSTVWWKHYVYVFFMHLTQQVRLHAASGRRAAMLYGVSTMATAPYSAYYVIAQRFFSGWAAPLRLRLDVAPRLFVSVVQKLQVIRYVFVVAADATAAQRL